VQIQGFLQPGGGVQPGGPSLQKSLHLMFPIPPAAAQAAALPAQDLMHCNVEHLAALNFADPGMHGQHALAPEDMVSVTAATGAPAALAFMVHVFT